MVKKDIIEFLRESNNIEDVRDDLSLQQALYAWEYIKKEKELNPSVIRKTHKILMLHQELMPNERGYFRKVSVWIGGREALDWGSIPEAIETWIKDVGTSILVPGKNGKHIRLDHVEYERIHPFVKCKWRPFNYFIPTNSKHILVWSNDMTQGKFF